MKQTDPQRKIRMPKHVLDWLEARARENASSVTSEIVRSVTYRMRLEPIERAAAESFTRSLAEQRANIDVAAN